MVISNTLSILLASDGNLPKGNIISFDIELLKSLGFVWLSVAVLIFILWKVLYNPVRNFIDNRSQSIADNIDLSNKKLEEAEELKKKYEEQLKEIDDERAKVLKAANKKAIERSDHIIKEAKKEAEHIYNHSMAEIEEERKEMQNDIKRQLIELSVMIAGRFIEDSMDESTHDKYIKEALSEWEEGLWLD